MRVSDVDIIIIDFHRSFDCIRKVSMSTSNSCQAELTSFRIMGTMTRHMTIAPTLRHVATPVARRTVYSVILLPFDGPVSFRRR